MIGFLSSDPRTTYDSASVTATGCRVRVGPWNGVVATLLTYQVHGSTHSGRNVASQRPPPRPMSKSIFQYLWYARYFERLAGVLSNEEVQILLRSQAETCRRLAVKNGRAAHVTIIPNGHRG